MNRRGFLRALGIGVGAAVAAPYLPALAAALPAPPPVLTYKGVPLVYDAACSSAQMYFINPKYLKLTYHYVTWQQP